MHPDQSPQSALSGHTFPRAYIPDDPAGGDGSTGGEACMKSERASDFDVYGDTPSEDHIDAYGATGTAEIELTDSLLLKSISAWR